MRRLEGIYTTNVAKAGAEIVKTRAVIEDAHTLRLADGRTVTAKYILIATGGTPNHGSEIPGIEHVISSNEAFHLPELPKRVLIQGGGYIALEFACIFAGFGSDVTVVYRGDNILRGFDEDVRVHVRKEMEMRGITILTGCTVDQIERQNNVFATHLSSGSSIAADKVMFAIGRHPNIGGLGLDKAGVALNPHNGGIAVDGFSRTSVPNIYAIGDVTHRVNLTPVAIREGHAFADTVFGKRPVQVDHATIPTAVFSQPEVGTVGLTEAEARAQFSHVDIYKTDFRPIKSTMSGRDTRILMKLVVDAHQRPRGGLPHRRRRRRRNHPGGRDCSQDEGDQGGFRRDLRAASDRRRRARDHADADRALCARGRGVGRYAHRNLRYFSSPKGSSTEWAGWVNQRAPSSVMTMWSSSRTPNSP